MNIYVGNLSYQTTEDDLRSAFESHGEVSSVAIIKDRETGRSKGFAFVEMADDASAREAIRNLDGADLQGRNIKVNEARPREQRSSSGPRGGGGGYGGGGGRRGEGGGGRRDRW
jgi:RNA recognition motif-containing protein